MLNVKNIVFDSFAILAFCQNEKGADKVENLLCQAKIGSIKLLINRINLGEVFYLTSKRKGKTFALEFLKNFPLLPLEIISVSDDLVDKAAILKAEYPISYADGFVAATALKFKASIVTGDKDFQHMEKMFSIIWL